MKEFKDKKPENIFSIAKISLRVIYGGVPKRNCIGFMLNVLSWGIFIQTYELGKDEDDC